MLQFKNFYIIILKKKDSSPEKGHLPPLKGVEGASRRRAGLKWDWRSKKYLAKQTMITHDAMKISCASDKTRCSQINIFFNIFLFLKVSMIVITGNFLAFPLYKVLL